jgi:hypothetical protein
MTHDDGFSVHVVGAQLWDPKRDNIDIEVRFADGRRYAATFFTIENLCQLFRKNQTTGECAGGIYLWAANRFLRWSSRLPTRRPAVTANCRV